MEKQNTKNPHTSTDGHLHAAAEAEETRKRKGCPTVLDKCVKKKNSPLNSTYSFTFDTKICGLPEPTPKFGSFNSDPGSAIKSKEKSKQEEGNEEPNVDLK
ncbi:abscisic acid responsive element-binding factor 1 [Perilla frutescens var. frutescens]|nr:abscisic acid responsive element-binding factor 1 [Perilla frutescens var. frutescens]